MAFLPLLAVRPSLGRRVEPWVGHVGAAGIAGGIVVSLAPPDATGASEYGVNVHTADYPSGAVRGQLGL